MLKNCVEENLPFSPPITSKCPTKVCILFQKSPKAQWNFFQKVKTRKPLTNPEVTAPETTENPLVVEKYKIAGRIANKALAAVRAASIEGAKLFDLCQLGDKIIVDELRSAASAKISKGIAFPTCVNPGSIPAHLSPVSAEDESNLTLAQGDVVNVMLGAQVDGYPAVVAETFVIGESEETPITGPKADLLHAAWNASEAAIRTLQQKGKKSGHVTAIVDKVAADFGTTAVQSMMSHNHEKNVLYGPKEIILNPAKEHKNQTESHDFSQYDVWGLDILVSTSEDGKVTNSKHKTTLFKLTGNSYALRLKSSHLALKEFKDKVKGPFPANIRQFDDPRKVRVGLIECTNHQVVLPYDVMEGKPQDSIAQFFTTVTIGPKGLVKYTSPTFNEKLYKTDKKVEDAEIAALIATPLPETQKKKKKPAKKSA